MWKWEWVLYDPNVVKLGPKYDQGLICRKTVSPWPLQGERNGWFGGRNDLAEPKITKNRKVRRRNRRKRRNSWIKANPVPSICNEINYKSGLGRS